jgi:hypothetical protein
MNESTQPLFLTEAELAVLCGQLVRPHARRRFLQSRGIPFLEGPGGQPVVTRLSVMKAMNLTTVGGPAPMERALVGSTVPDQSAFLEFMAARRPGNRMPR